MRLTVACLMLAGVAAPLQAQSGYQGSPSVTLTPPSFSVANEGQASLNYLVSRSSETPTMRKEKLRRAIDLRNEALRLQEQDGGILSAKHMRYIRARSRSILAYWGKTNTGGWVNHP